MNEIIYGMETDTGKDLTADLIALSCCGWNGTTGPWFAIAVVKDRLHVLSPYDIHMNR